MEILYPIAKLLAISALAEAVTETVKNTIPYEFTVKGKQVIALLSSIILAYAMHVSLLPTDGAEYYVGVILAGMVSSRGSTFIHSLAKVLTAIDYKKVK